MGPFKAEAGLTTAIVMDIPRRYWSFVFRRDAKGNFTRLHCESFFTGTKHPKPHDLERQLRTVAPSAITELTIQKASKNPFDDEDTKMLTDRVATFTKLKKLDAPWQRTRTGEEL